MRIEKHVFTPGTIPREAKVPGLLEKFQGAALINMTSRPLNGRVTPARNITERGKNLSEQTVKIVEKVPTPFLIDLKQTSTDDN